jgi:hypothetical protein
MTVLIKEEKSYLINYRKIWCVFIVALKYMFWHKAMLSKFTTFTQNGEYNNNNF